MSFCDKCRRPIKNPIITRELKYMESGWDEVALNNCKKCWLKLKESGAIFWLMSQYKIQSCHGELQ